MRILFVHGWSVTDTSTYGGLPGRLKMEPGLDVTEVFLGKYISFHDEVRFDDLARAMALAIERDVRLRDGERFAVITHSTGGPVVRLWWHMFYLRRGRECPMSHLVMLAPANFGSALARIGKGWAGGLRSFFQGIEPGRGVLDWLELGSPEAWELNREWMREKEFRAGDSPVYPFVLTGQRIDRRLYDHLNSYTGETGSDGTVRVAAANLNSRYLRLVQADPPPAWGGEHVELKLDSEESAEAPAVPMALVPGRAHSGERMGIMASVREDSKNHPTVKAILRCLRVNDAGDYARLAESFRRQNDSVLAAEWVEKVRRVGPDAEYHHPPCSMVIIRVTDDRGFPVPDYRLLLTGRQNNEDILPRGFFIDRQRNSRATNTLTLFLNHHAMSGAKQLGFKLTASPTEGFSHYLPAQLKSTRKSLELFLRPHETTMVDIVLRRVVHRGAFRFTKDLGRKSFKKQKPGEI